MSDLESLDHIEAEVLLTRILLRLHVWQPPDRGTPTIFVYACACLHVL